MILHGRGEISLGVFKNTTLEETFCISAQPCNILITNCYIGFFFWGGGSKSYTTVIPKDYAATAGIKL